MSTKNVFMGYCFFYALARFAATTIEYFIGSELQLPVLVVAETVSLIGIIMGAFWIAHKISPALVRALLALNSLAAITNLLVTRANPLTLGATGLDLLVIGSLFDLVLFFAAMILPMPEERRRAAPPKAAN